MFEKKKKKEAPEKVDLWFIYMDAVKSVKAELVGEYKGKPVYSFWAMEERTMIQVRKYFCDLGIYPEGYWLTEELAWGFLRQTKDFVAAVCRISADQVEGDYATRLKELRDD